MRSLAFLSTGEIGNQPLAEPLWHSLVNHVLAVKRRTDLESQDIEVI